MKKLDVNAFGIALASVFTLGAIMHISARGLGYMGSETTHMMGQFQMSMGNGFGLGIITILGHAIFGYIVGAFFVWVYNLIIGRKDCCGSDCCTTKK